MAQALIDVALGYVKAGNHAQALDLIATARKQVEPTSENEGKSQAMASIVEAYVAAGRYDYGLDVAQRIEDRIFRNDALSTVAEAYAAANELAIRTLYQ